MKRTPTTDEKALRATRQQAREYHASLARLSLAVSTFLKALDELMLTPSTVERGRKIAALANEMDLANDRVRHFDLGFPIGTKAQQKRRQPTP